MQKATDNELKHTQSLSTNLPALCANFVPGATVHLNGSIAELSSQGDNFGNDQFRNTARVCEWGVENGNTTASGISEVDLVGSDTEASDDEQVLGLAQNLLAQLCLGADTDNMDLASICQGQRMVNCIQDSCSPDLLNELVLGK